MPKQMIEVDVPDGKQVDAAYPVMRVLEGEELRMKPHADTTLYAVTFRPAWQWPEWLKASYIAMDKDGEWFGYENKPFIEDPFDTMWSVSGDSTYLEIKLLEFTPPPCDDWTKSLRENPNWNNKHKEPSNAKSDTE